MIEQLVQFALNNSIAALILATIVWAITRVWRNPSVSHVLWGLVFLKLICPTWVSLSLPVVSTTTSTTVATKPLALSPTLKPYLNDSSQEDFDNETYAANIQPAEITPLTFDNQPTNENSFNNEQANIALEETSPPKAVILQPIAELQLPAVINVSSQEPTTQKRPVYLAAKSTAPKAVAVSLIPFSWPTILLSTSLFGTAIWLLIVTRRITKFRQCVQLAEPVSQDVLAKAENIANQLGLRHLPAIRWVDGSLPPMLWFSGRDLCILLPRELWNNLTQEKQRLVLAHELIHVQRRDHVFRWAETIIFGLYWWNPVAWLARRHFHTAEDACCDQRTLELYPEHIADYGDLLVDSASFISQSHLPLATFAGGIGHPHTLKTRVQSMLENTKRGPLGWPTRCLLAIGCCMFLAVSTQLYSADESPLLDAESSVTETPELEPNNEDSFLSEPANTESNLVPTDDGAAGETTTDEEAFGPAPEDRNSDSSFDNNAPTSDEFGEEPANVPPEDNDSFDRKSPTNRDSNFEDADVEPKRRSGSTGTKPLSSAREKAQAALIAAIADPDPEVSEQAMLAVKRLGLISDDPTNKVMTPKLKAVMEQIAKNPDANLNKRLQAAVMLIPSKEHAELVLQTLLDCFVRTKQTAEANKTLLHLYQFLERMPSEGIAKSCQELSVSFNLKQLYKKIRKVSFSQPHRSNSPSEFSRPAEPISSDDFKVPPKTVLAKLSNNPVQQLTLHLSVTAILMGNSEVATAAFLEEYANELEKLQTASATPTSYKVGPAEHYVAIQQPPAYQSTLTTDEMGTILKLFRPETDAVLEFYIGQMQSENPKLRQLATAVLGNSLSGNANHNTSNSSRRNRGLSFGGGRDGRRRTSRDNDPFSNNVRTSDSMFGNRNLDKLDEATMKVIQIRYRQFVVIQKQINAIYQQKQKQHAHTHSDVSPDNDDLFDSRPSNNRRPKPQKNLEPRNSQFEERTFPNRNSKPQPKKTNDPYNSENTPDFNAPPFEQKVKKKTKSTTSKDDIEPAGRSGSGFF